MCVSCKGNKCHARAASGRRTEAAMETNHSILWFEAPGQTQHLVLANKNNQGEGKAFWVTCKGGER